MYSFLGLFVLFLIHLLASSRSNVNLVAFSWHPSNVNCLLTLNRDGCLNVAQLVERPAIVSILSCKQLSFSYFHTFFIVP